MKISITGVLRFLKNPQWVYVAIISAFFYAIYCYAGLKSIDAPVFHLDGAFQTANGLFRLYNGELPGRDFYPYLGIGLIGLLYPIFWIAGANLCASVFASYVTIFAGNVLSAALLIHFIWKPKRFLTSVISACAIFSIPLLLIINTSPFLSISIVPTWLDTIIAPGNSLRPLRGFIGYLAIFSLYFFIFPEKNKRRKFIYYGITIAIVSLWSNDYALLTSMALFLLAWVSFIKDGHNHFVKTSLQFISVSIISVVLAHFIVTGGHPLKLASYNFIGMARDQWWYFGPWLEVMRVFTPAELVKLFPILQSHYSLYVLAASFIAILIFKHSRTELLLVFVLGAILLIGGMIACVGGHILEYYFDSFSFWAMLTIFLFGLRLAIGLVLLLFAGKGKGILHIINIGICAVVIGTNAFYAYKAWINIQQQRKDSAQVFYVPELGGYLEQPWKDYVDYIKAHQDKTVVEEYSGIWGALLQKPSLWPVDSAIHALGDVRKMAEQAVREKADIIVTSNRASALEWLAWNETVNYWFYKILLENYTPVFYSPFTIVWEKDKPRPEGKTITCNIADSKDRIFLDAPEIGYYEVQLKTNIERLNKSRFLVMFENNINYSGLELGWLSISPYETDHSLLVYISNKQNRDFGLEARPAGSARISIESCTAKAVPFKNEHVLLLSEGPEKMYGKHALDYVWDDPYFWDRGIAANRAGFLVYRDKKALADFKFGNAVELPNKEIRIVTELGGSAAYLEVYLDGAKLNPDTIGLPTQFKAITDADGLEAVATKLGDAIFLTNQYEWISGVSRLDTQFIVANTKKNRELYKPPNRVQIPNTTERTINGVILNGVYLQVYVDGPKLESTTAGLPSGFKVIPVNQ